MSADAISRLKKELLDLENACALKREELARKVVELQKVCQHDIYIAEDNGDYHNPGYCYTCKNCGLLSMGRPVAGLINYK
jgi:hypothetical protein